MATTARASFIWDDVLLLREQLTDEERMVWDTATAYAQEKLKPRVLNAFRNEATDPAIFSEMANSVCSAQPLLQNMVDQA